MVTDMGEGRFYLNGGWDGGNVRGVALGAKRLNNELRGHSLTGSCSIR